MLPHTGKTSAWLWLVGLFGPSAHIPTFIRFRKQCSTQGGSGATWLFVQIFTLIPTSGNLLCHAFILSTSVLFCLNWLFLGYRKMEYGSPQSGCITQRPGKDKQRICELFHRQYKLICMYLSLRSSASLVMLFSTTCTTA